MCARVKAMSNTTHRLHGCETICFPIQPTAVYRSDLKLNICTSETTMKSDPSGPGGHGSNHSGDDEPSPISGAPSNDPSYQVGSKEDAEVTMCICPVCGFSASSPRGQDEHMETEHGECLTTGSSKSRIPRDRLSPVSDLFASSSFGVRASSTPQQHHLQTNQLEKKQQLPQQSHKSGDTSPVNVDDLGTNRLGLLHAISSPHLLCKSQLGQNQTNIGDISSHLIPVDGSAKDASSSTPGKSSSDWSQFGMKNRVYRGSLGRNARTTSTSKLTDGESSLTNALFLQKVDSRRRYRCNICPATFPWHGDLTEHLRLAHGMQKTRESARSGKAGNFCCNYCKYVAKYQSELRRHMRLHWGVKPFACVFCPYRSAWKGDLKRHMESHHRERFTSESELVEIMSQFKNNAGTTVNGFPLSAKSVPDAYNFGSDFESENTDDASFQFQDSHDHSSGEASLSGFPKPLSIVDPIPVSCSNADTLKTENQFEDPLVCTVCSYRAQNQSKLQNHMTGHMNLKPFKCPICEHRSNYKWDVRKHLRTQHPNQADRSVVVLSGLEKTAELTVPFKSSSPESPMSLCIDLASKTPEQQTTTSGVPRDLSTHLWSAETATVECEPDSEVVPIDLSVKDQVNSIVLPTSRSPGSEANFSSVQLKPPVTSGSVVIQHTVSSLVDSQSIMINPLSSGVDRLKSNIPMVMTMMEEHSSPMVQNSSTVPSRHSSPPVSSTISCPPAFGVDHTDVLVPGTNSSNTIGLILNLQQQLLIHGLIPSWPSRTVPNVAVTNPMPLTLRVSSAVSTDSLMHGLNQTDNIADLAESNGIQLSDASPDNVGIREKKTPSEWSSTDTDPLELLHSGRSTLGANLVESSEGLNDPPRRARGRKSATCYSRQGGGGGGGGGAGGSGGSIGPKEEQWKRHLCSGCGHRSNWKWDINKHIKVAHPERTNITTVTLDLEEAKQTFGEYMNRLKLSRSRYLNEGTAGSLGVSTGSGPTWCGGLASTGEGYYRPYKCSVCGHRSNWKWDVRKHIKQMHNSEAEVITLSLEEARRTIHQYKSCRRQQQARLVETTFKSEPSQCYDSTGQGNVAFVAQDQPKEMDGLSPENSPNIAGRNDSSNTDIGHVLETAKREQNSCIVQIDENAGLDGHGVGPIAGAVDGEDVSNLPLIKLYYRCRHCDRRFRSYQNLFFHLHHKHHTEVNNVKSASTPPLSIRFCYEMSSNSPRARSSNPSQRTKVLLNHGPISRYSSDDQNQSSTERPNTFDHALQLEVDDRSLRGTIDTPNAENSSKGPACTNNTTTKTTSSMEPKFLLRNEHQRDRVLRARRRTGNWSLRTTSPLLSCASHNNISLVSRDLKADHSNPSDCLPQTVRLLVDLLDNVLNILEGKPYPVVTESTGSKLSNENGDCEVISHLTNLIQQRLAKNEKANSYAIHPGLDTSTSSNEENQPLSNVDQMNRIYSSGQTRPVGRILHHPEIEQRFLRLVTLFYGQGHDQSVCTSKRFRSSDSPTRTKT